VPLIVVVLIRLYNALKATFNLVTDWKLLRTMPWSYIRRLPFKHFWIGLATVSLIVTIAMTIGVAVAPDSDVRATLYSIGLYAVLAGIISSWVRAILQWIRLRG
jgi:hypothetical protein